MYNLFFKPNGKTSRRLKNAKVIKIWSTTIVSTAPDFFVKASHKTAVEVQSGFWPVRSGPVTSEWMRPECEIDLSSTHTEEELHSHALTYIDIYIVVVFVALSQQNFADVQLLSSPCLSDHPSVSQFLCNNSIITERIFMTLEIGKFH
jgi:hypothetical protein